MALGARPVRIMVGAYPAERRVADHRRDDAWRSATSILTESVLSFLGLGIQPPLPSWGNMLTNAQELIWQAPLLAIYPGPADLHHRDRLQLLGDALQDAMDPRAHEP